MVSFKKIQYLISTSFFLGLGLIMFVMFTNCNKVDLDETDASSAVGPERVSCGGADGKVFSEPPSSGLCLNGGASTVKQEGDGEVHWTCSDADQRVNCSASIRFCQRYASPLNLVCNSDEETPEEIINFYLNEMDRCPDQSGVSFWLEVKESENYTWDDLFEHIRSVPASTLGPTYVEYIQCAEYHPGPIGHRLVECMAEQSIEVCEPGDAYVEGTIHCEQCD